MFRPGLDRTSTFDVRTIWDPIVFTCMVQVRYKYLLKRLQVVKIGYTPKLDQISPKFLNIKTVFYTGT